MKNRIKSILTYVTITSLTFFTLVSCKPDKEPEPDTIEEKSTLKINLTKNSIVVGETLDLSANLLTGTSTDIANDVLWSVSDNDKAEIVSGASLLGKATGTIQLIAFKDLLSDTIVVNVLSADAVARDISIEAIENEIGKNSSTIISVSVKDENGIEIALENTSYSSSNPSVGTIDANGNFTSAEAGETEIEVKSNGLTSKTITVSVFRTGSFSGKNGYTVNGKARLISRNGQLVVELYDGFRTPGGPDLRVFLSNAVEGGGVKAGQVLASLKMNSGDQTYTVPSSVNMNDFDFVNVHCDQFTKTFGTVTLD